jgi:hypothetical protein
MHKIMLLSKRTASTLLMSVVAAAGLGGAARATTITFAAGQYDNTANTVTGTNAAPLYNNNQTTGVFRDVFWWGTAYNGGTKGVGSPDFINSGPNLVSNGTRAVVGGNDTALNFTGVKTTSSGASFMAIYDTTPQANVVGAGQNAAGQNVFTATPGGIRISTDILFGHNGHAVSGGIVAMYNEGLDGLALLAGNGGGNNPDKNSLNLVFQQNGTPTVLSSISLGAGGTQYLGDTNSSSTLLGDQWYRIIMDLKAVGDSYTISGSFFNHVDPGDPNSLLGTQIGSTLMYSGSLSNPGNALDLTNPGEIGLMATTPENFSDGVAINGTAANPLVDNIGISFTNFSFPDDDVLVPGNNIPEPATLAVFGLGLMGMAAARRRRG